MLCCQNWAWNSCYLINTVFHTSMSFLWPAYGYLSDHRQLPWEKGAARASVGLHMQLLLEIYGEVLRDYSLYSHCLFNSHCQLDSLYSQCIRLDYYKQKLYPDRFVAAYWPSRHSLTLDPAVVFFFFIKTSFSRVVSIDLECYASSKSSSTSLHFIYSTHNIYII